MLVRSKHQVVAVTALCDITEVEKVQWNDGLDSLLASLLSDWRIIDRLFEILTRGQRKIEAFN